MALEVVNHDPSYASDDEIQRTQIIKNVEENFMEHHLNGIQIDRSDDVTRITFSLDEEQTLEVSSHQLVFQEEVYPLNSKNATYQTCVEYEYMDLENDYYLVTLTIPVLIDGVNTTRRDDLVFTYLGLKNATSNYLLNFTC